MKQFIIFTTCAIVALTSCQKIDEPVITPEQSSFKVSAVIDDNSTKVTYEVTDDAVTPAWAVGDKILVYDGTGTAELTVNSVGPDGVATFADGYTPTEGATTLYAVYYPGKGTEDFANGQLKVDLTDQNGAMDGTTPAIMCATASFSGDEVRFRFYNQTAIIGVKKFQVNPDEEIGYISVKGLIAKGTIKVVDGTLSLVPATETTDMTVKFDSAIRAGSDGIYSTPIYFMALPTVSAKIGIAASSATFTHCNTTAVNANDIKAGHYYYLSKKLDTDNDHVARYTNDGGAIWTYTESLTAAINGITATSKADGIVELLKDDAIDNAELPSLSGKKLTIKGNDHTYDISNRTKEFATDASTDVTFDDIVIDGKENYNSSRFLINNGTVTFEAGVEFKGVYFSNPQTSTSNMYFYGGLLYNYNDAVININGAYIHDCAVKSEENLGISGGLIANMGAKVYMTSGVVENVSCEGTSGNIRGAFAYNTNGNSKNSQMIISGGTFKSLKADYGGMVSTYKGTTEISNATIEGCKAKYGGAIHNLGIGNTSLVNVTIKNCEAETYGGAICSGYPKEGTNKAKLTISDCSISGCTSGNYGSVLYNYGYSEATINSGTYLCDSAQPCFIDVVTNSKLTVYGGCFYNKQTASLITYASSGSKPVLYGGYYSQNIGTSKITLGEGHTFIDNPNETSEDKSAFNIGCKYKVE